MDAGITLMVDFNELGSTGLRRGGGVITEEFLNRLRGSEGARAYREMADNDPVVGAMMFAIERLLMRVEWRVDPYVDKDTDEPSAKDLEVSDFVESCRHDMSDSWSSTLSQILSFLLHGWSFHEIVYKRRVGPAEKDAKKRSRFTDGKIGWRKLPIRAQDTLIRWYFDDSGGLVSMEQLDPSTGVRATIPIEKALLFRTTTVKGNPEGRSVVRNAYRPWYYKRRIEEFEAIGIERDLAGLPVAWVPPQWMSSDATADEKQAFGSVQAIVQGVKRNEAEGIVMPMLYDNDGHRLVEFTVLNSGGTRQFDIDKTVSRYDQRIAMTVLADFILLGHENVGSFSLGASKVDLFTTAIEAWGKMIADVFNDHAIPRLLEVNGMDVTRAPKLVVGDVTAVDLGQIADYVSKLTSAGIIVTDEDLEDHMRQIASLPPIDHEARDAKEAEDAQAQADMEAQMAADTGSEDAIDSAPAEEPPADGA